MPTLARYCVKPFMTGYRGWWAQEHHGGYKYIEKLQCASTTEKLETPYIAVLYRYK